MKRNQQKAMFAKKHRLSQAAYDTRGQLAVSPGTDMGSRLDASESTIRGYVSDGYLKRAGSGLILTKKGYDKI